MTHVFVKYFDMFSIDIKNVRQIDEPCVIKSMIQTLSACTNVTQQKAFYFYERIVSIRALSGIVCRFSTSMFAALTKGCFWNAHKRSRA